jgi:hypothetical protein
MNMCFVGFGSTSFNVNSSDHDFLVDELLCSCENEKQVKQWWLNIIKTLFGMYSNSVTFRVL